MLLSRVTSSSIVLLLFVVCLSSLTDFVVVADDGGNDDDRSNNEREKADEPETNSRLDVTYINFYQEEIKLLWMNEATQQEMTAGTLGPYEDISISSNVGDYLYYVLESSGERFDVEVERPVRILSSSDDVYVECMTTTGMIHINVKPDWSPLGAARFLDLVDMGYYDKCALNRVVDRFLTQFGISANYELRTKYRSANIQDDVDQNIPFEPGFMSYAGYGPNSRSTEMFIVQPNAAPHTLQNFGTANPWETPFGFVEFNDLEPVVAKWNAQYGDIPPYGTGPDPQKIYLKDGYDYLQKEFPAISYIESCTILDEEVTEEEL